MLCFRYLDHLDEYSLRVQTSLYYVHSKFSCLKLSDSSYYSFCFGSQDSLISQTGILLHRNSKYNMLFNRNGIFKNNTSAKSFDNINKHHSSSIQRKMNLFFNYQNLPICSNGTFFVKWSIASSTTATIKRTNWINICQ